MRVIRHDNETVSLDLSFSVCFAVNHLPALRRLVQHLEAMLDGGPKGTRPVLGTMIEARRAEAGDPSVRCAAPDQRIDQALDALLTERLEAEAGDASVRAPAPDPASPSAILTVHKDGRARAGKSARRNRRGPRPRPLPVPDAEATAILSTMSLQAASIRLGITRYQAYAWRHRLGIGNPHVPYTRLQDHPPLHSKGLTWPVIAAALRAHPEGLHLGTLVRQCHCSRQAVHHALLCLERRGLVQAQRFPSGRRHGWVIMPPACDLPGRGESGAHLC